MAYSDDYFLERESWRDWRIEAQSLLKLARVRPGMLVLEIGCGAGGLLRQLSRCGARTIGVDSLYAALDLSRRRDDAGARSNLVLASAEEALAFRAATFDAIVGQHVVEHLTDVDRALREWRRLVKPGGRIALATPNAQYADPSHFADPQHVHIFTPVELKSVIAAAGWHVEHCSTVFPFLSRQRALRAVGVAAYRWFQSSPYFGERGRTILVSAYRSE